MSGKTLSRKFWPALVALATAVAVVLPPVTQAQKPDRVLEPVGAPYPGRAPDLPWRVLDAVSYENLLIFPVVARSGYDTGAYVTLDEALSSGDVVVGERGSDVIRRARDGRGWPEVRGSAQVNQLVLVNRGKRPVLLLAGEVVSGGKQDRVIGKDRIVAPGSDPLPLDVFCVERGRWTATNAGFGESKFMAHPSVRERAAVDKQQDKVWAAVRSGTTAQAPASAEPPTAPARVSRQAMDSVVAESRSEAYGKIYGSRQVQGTLEGFSEEISRRFRGAVAGLRDEQVVGVIVAYSGEVAWSDVFASNTLFERYWPKLLRSYVVEALARPHYRERASVQEARVFLAPLVGRETIESEPGVYRWREIAAGRQAQIELDSLLGRTFTLHRVKILRTS